jgi:tetratricopeptide (TPR) repeat protein
MKRNISLGLAFLAFVYLSTTAFQCGSADFSSGKLYLGQKNYAKAEESLLREVTKNPGNADAWLFLSETRFNMNRFMDMRESLNKYDELCAKDPGIRTAEKKSAEDFWLRKGWEKSHNEGIEVYNRFVADRNTAHLDSAIQKFTVAVAMQPDSLISYYYRGAAYSTLKNDVAQMADYRKVYDRDPGYLEVAKYLGNLYYYLGDQKSRAKDSVGSVQMFNLAADCYEKAMVVQPNDPDVLANLISSYALVHRLDKAVEVARVRVEKNPGDRFAHYILGYASFYKQDYPTGVAEFQKCLDIDSLDYDAHDYLGRCLVNWAIQLQDAAKAKEEAERAKSKGKKTQTKEDQSYVEKFLQALPHIEKACAVKEKDVDLWRTLAKLYLISNQPEKSKKAFEVVDRLTKGN